VNGIAEGQKKLLTDLLRYLFSTLLAITQVKGIRLASGSHAPVTGDAQSDCRNASSAFLSAGGSLEKRSVTPSASPL